MAQHDFNIANADGATFRADLNSALEAMASNNSGSSAPATTFAYMDWADTGNNLLKKRDSTNTSWVTVGTLTGLQQAAAGAVGTPSFAFSAYPTTGFYQLGANIIGIATAGVLRGNVGAAGVLRWAQNTTDNPGNGNTTTGFALSGTQLFISHASTYSMQLNVNADAFVETFARSGTQVGGVSVNTTTTSYNTTSDRRLKYEIGDADYDPEWIKKIKVRAYRFKAAPTERHIGVIAQEVIDIAPEAVTAGDSNPECLPGDIGFKQWHVDPAKLIYRLMQEVQSLSARVHDLEAAAAR